MKSGVDTKSSPSGSSAKPFGIQPLQLAKRKHPILPHQLLVKVDLPAAVVLALDAHHVPVDLALVAVVGLLVRLAGREVEAAGDLFVEEDVLHRPRDVRVEAEAPLADV